MDVADNTEEKNGLAYLSWSYAWAEVKRKDPEANYIVKRFGENNLPYVFDPNTGYMVFTEMTIGGTTHEMWMTVMDSNNKAMKDHSYTYEVKRKDTKVVKTVEAADMFDINKAIMRCLVKNIAMFGLGLSLYQGEKKKMPPRSKPINAPQSEELKRFKNEVIVCADKKIKEGISRDEIYKIILNHSGNKNPNSIKSVQICKDILEDMNKLQSQENKEAN